ncbi:O-antigen ligase family protein [Candidatus Gottesmanbacteria bacterium]|nr:O-antigen ligase family protein [Candidatus Gottesmanbacteria bacterium]
MQKLLSWIDDHILSILAGFLLVFIPLYPKLPILDILPGYIVRVRLEDFLVSFCFLLWVIWILRGKIKLTDNPLLKPILIYLLVGLLSIFSAVFIIKTIPIELIFVEKILLHFLRRIEYFSLFFIFYSTVKNIKTLKVYIGLFVATVIAVAIYGFGQKYLYWPAFSTMNREFSKGWVLYLTEHARVLSTFGGHYDLAAFVMMALVILWSLFFGVRKWVLKTIIFLSIAAAFWTLILTASRTSFLAYLAGVTLMFFFWAYKKGIRWSFLRWTIVMMLSIVIMLSFGDLSERFTKLLRIDERIAGIKSLVMSPIGKPPTDKAIFLENNPNSALAQITSKSDQPPTVRNPSDVYENIPLYIPIASGSATVSAVARTYSKTAFQYDLSTAIRLDALWPMAINGFKRNPLFGSGYSTLNKSQINDFTEAESTDNDYLRSLGETGLLGFITFFGTLLFVIYFIWRNLTLIQDPVFYSIAIGVGGLTLGLLVNAVYIDVFESSKVAFSYWSIVGFTLAGINIIQKDRKNIASKSNIYNMVAFSSNLKTKASKFFRSDFFILFFILILAFVLRLYKINTPLADWHSWRQADTSAVTRNYVKHGINLLYPTYDDLSNVASGKNNPKGLRFVEFPVYNVASVIIDKIFVGYTIEVSQRLTSIFSTLGSIIFLFLITRKYIGRKEAILSALLFTVLPYNVFFTRVILPEPFLVFTSLGMLFFFDKFIESIASKVRKFTTLNYFICAFIFTTVSLLIKPVAAFLFLPMAYLWFKEFKISLKSLFNIGIFLIIALLPLLWWRWWIGHYPEGIPAFTWLLNGDGIRFKGAFFYWLFADRLAREILGYWGLPFFVLGIFTRDNSRKWFFYWWGIAILAYVTFVATGNVRHDYYQIFTIPIIVIFMSRGIVKFLEIIKSSTSKLTAYIFVLIMLGFALMFGWYYIRDYYNINHPEIVEAGRAVETKTKNNTLVIAPYNGDTAFLYQANRAGWPIMQEPIDKMISMGADYYVSVTFDDLTKKLIADSLNPDLQKRKYKLVDLTDKYAIIQLVSDNKLPK